MCKIPRDVNSFVTSKFWKRLPPQSVLSLGEKFPFIAFYTHEYKLKWNKGAVTLNCVLGGLNIDNSKAKAHLNPGLS